MPGRIITLLQQPYPAPDRRRGLKTAIFVGAFVGFFLLVFQPFGLGDLPGSSHKYLAIAGYGLVSFFISLFVLLFPAVIPAWFRPQKWTVGKDILFSLLACMLVGLANFLYSAWIFGLSVSPGTALFFQAVTLIVGLLPLSFIIVLRYHRLQKMNAETAGTMNTSLETLHKQEPESSKETTVTFPSETAAGDFVCKPSELLYLESADNYIEIHYLLSGEHRKQLVRSNLTRAEEVLQAYPRITRCHRTFIVNLDHVSSFSGNAQGLKLNMAQATQAIPVARRMVPHIRTLLNG